MIFSLSSCFTGVEGTKKITLSKDDRKQIRPSEEDLFLSDVVATPLSDWNPGRIFYVADNKAILIFDQQGLPLNPDVAALGGQLLFYKATTERRRPDGKIYAAIVFNDDKGNTYTYDTGKTIETAPSAVMSDNIPMLIDMTMIQLANQFLAGRKLWTRSALRYDKDGNRIPGRKFVPVTIRHALPGSIAFPLKVAYSDDRGEEGYAFLNFGNSGTDSRSFSHIFSLNDLRKKFPSITDEHWELICNEKITLGMTKDECRLALGNPTEVSAGHDYSQTLDLWHYPDGTVLWFEDGLLTRFRK